MADFLPPQMSFEMAQKVIVPQKKNYVPQFLKQRDINSYIKLQIFSGFLKQEEISKIQREVKGKNINRALKVLTNDKRGGLRVTSFDRPPFKLLSRKFS